MADIITNVQVLAAQDVMLQQEMIDVGAKIKNYFKQWYPDRQLCHINIAADFRTGFITFSCHTHTTAEVKEVIRVMYEEVLK